MNKNNAFYMWGERGLIATFFADIYQIPNLEVITKLLQMMQFQNPPAGSDAVPIGATFIIEPDFGNMGFGHPDIVIKIQYEDYAVNIIGEAKRTTFEQACCESSRRGTQKFNGKLNGQLELNYRLAIALSQFKDGDRELIEPEWILNTPYNYDGKCPRQKLKNPNVLREVVSLIGGEKFDRHYYLVITTDEKNPLLAVQKTFLPQLFNKPESSETSVDCWSEYNKRFGWLNYKKMKEFIESLQNQLPIGSLFLPTYKFNEKNMGKQTYQVGLAGETKRGSKGSCLIYAPEINSETFLHFSWQNEGSALRDYSKSETIDPVPDTSFRTSEVEQKMEIKEHIPRRKRYTDVAYWHRTITEVNQKYLQNGYNEEQEANEEKSGYNHEKEVVQGGNIGKGAGKLIWERASMKDDVFDLRVKNPENVNVADLQNLLEAVEKRDSGVEKDFDKDEMEKWKTWLNNLKNPWQELPESAYAVLNNWAFGKGAYEGKSKAIVAGELWDALFCVRPERRMTDWRVNSKKLLTEEFNQWWPKQLKCQKDC